MSRHLQIFSATSLLAFPERTQISLISIYTFLITLAGIPTASLPAGTFLPAVTPDDRPCPNQRPVLILSVVIRCYRTATNISAPANRRIAQKAEMLHVHA